MNFAGSEKSNEAERPKSVSDCFYALANPPTEHTYQREIRTERRSSRFHSSTRRFRAVISTRVAWAPTASRRELAAHRKISLATYFGAPRDFDIWWDPTLPSGQVITFQAGPGNDTVTLAALQSHLNALHGRGIRISLTKLHPDGYSDHSFTGSPHPGGVFEFDSQGRASAGAPMAGGGGKGMVDCVTGKLVDVVIDGW